MTPEEFAEIEHRQVDSLNADAPHNPDVWTLEADRKALVAEVKRLQAEKDAALAYARRLLAERDAVARAVRSPNLTDAEKFEEIREAFAVVEGQSEEAGR
jgi:hypothetical protein